ncbi:MAG TPA: phosphate ABC transporter ATP-binding protein [Acidimicrobiales bacterium]|nr:phosphate ABC transporter ATP-binding protein [Acidimicrobiales bacterium]
MSQATAGPADSSGTVEAGSGVGGVGAAVLTGPPALSVRDLSLGFGSATVMKGITVDIAPGTITALVGPSGSGKTTFLRSLNRMNDRVRSFWKTGEILFHGVDVHDRSMDLLELRRRIGMVFQRPNPFPMSIEANVVAGARAHRMCKRSNQRDLAETCLAEVGLWAAVADRLNDSPYRLSGGQQQLLCLARALAVQPEILLLDEPTSSLDPVSTEAVEELLRRLAGKLTIVIVTHNLAQAKRLSDQTIFFYQGELVETGPTDRLFSTPERPETARYFGGLVG